MTHGPLAIGCIYNLRLHGYFITLSLQLSWHKENKAIMSWFFVHGSLFLCPHRLHWISFLPSIVGVGSTSASLYWCSSWRLGQIFFISLSIPTLPLLPLFSAREGWVVWTVSKESQSHLLPFGFSPGGFLARDLKEGKEWGQGVYPPDSLPGSSPQSGLFPDWRSVLLSEQPIVLSLLLSTVATPSLFLLV